MNNLKIKAQHDIFLLPHKDFTATLFFKKNNNPWLLPTVQLAEPDIILLQIQYANIQNIFCWEKRKNWYFILSYEDWLFLIFKNFVHNLLAVDKWVFAPSKKGNTLPQIKYNVSYHKLVELYMLQSRWLGPYKLDVEWRIIKKTQNQS